MPALFRFWEARNSAGAGTIEDLWNVAVHLSCYVGQIQRHMRGKKRKKRDQQSLRK